MFILKRNHIYFFFTSENHFLFCFQACESREDGSRIKDFLRYEIKKFKFLMK